MAEQRDEHSPSNFLIDPWPSIKMKNKVCTELLSSQDISQKYLVYKWPYMMPEGGRGMVCSLV